MATVSKDSLLIDRQMKLDRQKQILEQKRRIRQQQVHSGMVIASGIGSRPSSAKSTNSRPSSSIPSVSNGIIAPSVSDTINRPVTDITTIQVLPVIPSSSELLTDCDRDTTDGDREEETKLLSDCDMDTLAKEETKLLSNCDMDAINTQANEKTDDEDKPSTAIKEEVVQKSNVPSLSEKLTSLGLSAAVSGYHSDSSDEVGEEALQGCNDDVQFLSPGVSPLHEASILPQELTEDQKSTQINDNPLDVKFDGETIIGNLNEVVFKVPKESVTVKCRIIRDKQGLDKHMYPIYYMYMEQENNKKLFLLAGRKKKRSRSSYYIISTDSADLSRNGKNFVAKLRSNFIGTSFTVYDNGCKLPTDNIDALREELALVSYETNVLGFKGPRKMGVVIPSLDKDGHRISVRPTREPDTLLERYKNDQMSHLVQLHNKQPVWSADTQAFVLNFHGRVTQASVKNFQLVHTSNEDYVVVQFGRIAEDTFTLDYQFPVCAVQAFAIALSSFDSKWACE